MGEIATCFVTTQILWKGRDRCNISRRLSWQASFIVFNLISVEYLIFNMLYK